MVRLTGARGERRPPRGSAVSLSVSATAPGAGRAGSTVRARARARARGGGAGGTAEVADVARRAAVLLQAGVAPHAVWTYLAVEDASAAAVLNDLDRGMPQVAAIAARGASWRELAIAWAVASAVGAALAEALRAFALGLRDAAEAQDDIAVALSEPAATARLMMWLPAVGLLMGAGLGFDTLGILVTDPRGLTCLVLGLLLIVTARLWTRRLISRARPAPGLPGIDAELFAIALSGGASIDAAAEHVRRARLAVAALDMPTITGRTRAAGAAAAGRVPDAPTAAAARARGPDIPAEAIPADVRGVLALSRAAGVPAVELLRAESAGARHRARVEGRLRASKLSTRLLLPLGICTLPSFLLLAVAPLVLSILGTTHLPALLE